MNERQISKFILDEFLKSDDLSYAIADKNQKVVWFNKKFKKDSGLKQIKGSTVSNLFNLNAKASPIKNHRKISTLKLPSLSKRLTITSLKNKYGIEGYLLKLEKLKGKSLSKRKVIDNNKNLLFPQTLQQILTLLLKEKSLKHLADEILKRCVEISGSKFGIIVFYDEANKKSDFQFYDPSEEIRNREEVKKEIQSSISFINKWFVVNKHSLVTTNLSGSIGFHISQVLQSGATVISPCLFDQQHLASIIVGKKEGSYSQIEVNNIEQFAALLSFSISNIRTRELNAALESRLMQAQKLETIGKLSSGMAHDFSNLLSSIFGSLNLLKKKVPPKEEIFRLLENIESCSIRAKDLTKGLLSFGKPTPKRKELIKPNSLLTEISKVINQTFPAKIIFESQIEENLYDILGSGTEIYQVLLNLCVNAKEAIDGKGKISLAAKNITVSAKNASSFPLLNKEKYVWISVSDTGAGIREENITKIFDPYFSTKSKQTGSGLGLYVTYGIIKAHKGHIEVSSVLNKGTTFDVFIPAFEPPAEGKQIPAGKIILLVDDEVMLSDLLSELLESYGYNVIKVSTGMEALKVLTEEIKVDLAIIDYNMPQMDGLQCVKQIRELQFTMPVILSSGSLNLGIDFDYKKAGISATLSKPYEFETMLATIQKLI